MNMKRNIAFCTVFVLALGLAISSPASAFDCIESECEYITSIDIIDIDGNNVIVDSEQVVKLTAWGPPVKVIVHFTVPENIASLTPRAICIIKGAHGETFVSKKKIKEAGDYQFSAEYLVMPYFFSGGLEEATIQVSLKIKKKSADLKDMDRADVTLTVSPLKDAE